MSIFIAPQQNDAYTDQVSRVPRCSGKGGRDMTIRSTALHALARLHVFEQEGGWHWGITIPRSAGSGFKLIAYSETTFRGESEARCDGSRALENLPHDAALAFAS
jgi:hypothetical protein